MIFYRRLHDMRKYCLAVLWLFAVMGMAEINAEDKKTDKMCWAHLVCWGSSFQSGYDRAFAPDNVHQLIPYSDRSLLGKYVQEANAIWTCSRKQIESALQWGIDGFCVDIIGDPKIYKGVMSRFYRDAQGTDFKIALCIDQLSYPLDHTVKYLGDFILAYKDHPNTCLIDGKMVIFIYNLGRMNTEKFKELRQKLAERGADAYFLIQPMRETAMWDNPNRMSAFSGVSDGFYDFGCNGFSPKQMKTRLANGRKYLKKGGLLCAGIAQGYIGQFTAFYRPYLNTGSLRHSWEAAIANNADWVCLTTWNDYIENTQFEPSVNNRSNLLRINREYLYKWRKQASPPRPAQAMLNYMEEAVAGNDVTIELLNFSYTGQESEAVIRILELNGKVFREFKSDLKRNDLTAETFRMTPAELGRRTCLRVQFSVAPKGGKHQFREFMPIIRRPDWLSTVRTFRGSYDDHAGMSANLSIQKSQAKIRLNTWIWAGKVELLRNNWPIWETEISHNGKPFVDLTVPLDRDVFPEDYYIVRFSDSSDRVGFSNPARKQNFTPGETVKSPVIVTNCDFDESWPLWTQRPRKLTTDIQKMDFLPQNIYQVRFNMDKDVPEKLVFSDSLWKIGALAGKGATRYWVNDKNCKPQSVKNTGPDGKERIVWRFDGGDNITLASRAFPHGPMTIEMWVRPAGGKGILFSTAGTSLTLDDKMAVTFVRSPEGNTKSIVTSGKTLPVGQWTHIAAVFSGNAIELFFNGVSVGKRPANPVTFGVNAIPVIGNAQQRTSGGFKGDMAGFALYGGTPQNGKFQLK